jgi:hypothetical protein
MRTKPIWFGMIYVFRAVAVLFFLLGLIFLVGPIILHFRHHPPVPGSEHAIYSVTFNFIIGLAFWFGPSTFIRNMWKGIEARLDPEHQVSN